MFFKKIDPQELLSSFLLPNETLLWSGQPMQGVIWTLGKILFLCFVFIAFPLLSAFCIGAYINVGGSDVSFFQFSLIVGWGVFGMWAMQDIAYPSFWERKNTFYGITSNRIMICKGIFKPAVLSINFKNLKQVQLVQLSHGRGYILLGPNMPRLQTIQEVGKPYQLILALQQT
jgi:hypothetical protein